MRRPLRLDEEYNEYVKDFYRKIEDYDWIKVTDNHEGLESLLHRRREKEIKRLLGKYHREGRYLDAGCGTGLLLRHLPEGSVGVDINPRHVKLARQYVSSASIIEGDIENLVLDEAQFSVAVCTEVLEHLVIPQKALGHIARVLVPGGLIIGSTPRRSLIWRLRFLSSTHYHNEPFHNEFVRSELTDLFKSFKIRELKTGIMGAMFFFVLEKKV